MSDLSALSNTLRERLGDRIQNIVIENHEITLQLNPAHLVESAVILRDDPALRFAQLMDLCGVDYLHYGLSEWQTEQATFEGFSRAKSDLQGRPKSRPPHVADNDFVHPHRFAVVYHLLSITHNHRIRLKIYLPEENLRLNSVLDIWPSANWYEREAFDLFGFIFENHPDLRRILTDYEFAGHPFRKDFPLSGHVEVRYCETEKRVVYQPVSIKDRTLVPKTIRDDYRNERN